MDAPNVSAIVIEDDEMFRLLLTTTLEDMGVDVVGEAGNGQDGIDLYRVQNPDIVFCDVQMPVKDGIAVLKEIRGFDPVAKIVIMTSLSDHLAQPECTQLGAMDFIQKDMATDIFNLRLQSILSKVSL